MIDYSIERNKYRPQHIKTLLIAEAPPPSGKSFFYVPKPLQLNRSIENDTSLPSTIFNHYFERRPKSVREYKLFLRCLQRKGVFLVDLLDEPIRIRGNKENEKYLISKIPDFRNKIKLMDITLEEENWIFLLARSSYKKKLKEEFPLSRRIRWIDFRLKRIE
jgi:hypothetical protein